MTNIKHFYHMTYYTTIRVCLVGMTRASHGSMV